MPFLIQAKVRGEDELIRALGLAPGVFLRFMRAWMADERANFLGGPGSKKQKKRGYRDILDSKRRARRPGVWSRSVTHQFKGYITGDRIDTLQMRAGVGLNHPHKISRALWKLQESGSIHSRKFMPIPIYKNLLRMGLTGSRAQVATLGNVATRRDLGFIRSGDRVLVFDRSNRKGRKGIYGTRISYPRSSLLYVLQPWISVSRQFTGRYDFYGRWNQMQTAMVRRGQGVMDRATAAVLEKGRLQ